MSGVLCLGGFGRGQFTPDILLVKTAYSSGSTIAYPSGLVAGDLAVLWDIAVNTTTAIPTAVTPAGFTQRHTLSGLFTASNGARSTIHTRLLTGTESGSITGMNGTQTNRKIMLVFRAAAPITAFTVNTVGVFSPASINTAGRTTPIVACLFGISNTVVSLGLAPESGSFEPDSSAKARYKVFDQIDVPGDLISSVSGGTSRASHAIVLSDVIF